MKLSYLAFGAVMSTLAAVGCTTDQSDVDAARRDAAQTDMKAENNAEEKAVEAQNTADEKTAAAYDQADQKEAKAEQKLTETEQKAYIDKLEQRLEARRADMKTLAKGATTHELVAADTKASDELTKLRHTEGNAWFAQRRATDRAFASLDEAVRQAKATH